MDLTADIPDELIIHICSFLDVESLRILLSLNTRYYNIVHDYLIRQHKYKYGSRHRFLTENQRDILYKELINNYDSPLFAQLMNELNRRFTTTELKDLYYETKSKYNTELQKPEIYDGSKSYIEAYGCYDNF